MKEQIKSIGSEIAGRWHQRMPRFFYWLTVVACSVAATAYAINSGLPAMGGTHSDWWEVAYRYIVSTCIGIVVVCKLTVAGGYKKIDPDKIIHGDNTILDEDIDHMHGESPSVQE